jgi:hypothetical protein
MPERGVLAVPAACRPAGSSRPAPLRCILHGTARQASGGRRDGTGRDEEGEAERGWGPGWRGGPGGGAESRECRGGATHDGGQDVSHDVTGAGGQGIKSRLAGPSSRLPVGPWLPSNHTNGGWGGGGGPSRLGFRPRPKQCSFSPWRGDRSVPELRHVLGSCVVTCECPELNPG